MSRDGGRQRIPRDGRLAPRPRGQAPAQHADASPLFARLQRTAGNASVADLIDGMSPAAAVQQVLAGPAGAPLDAAMQARMEAAYGADFSSVRVHTGQDAAASAAALGARAYTVGEDIVLGAHAVDEQTMAHELAHVVQQREGPVDGKAGPDGLSVSDPDDRFEQAAESVAGRVSAGPAPDGSLAMRPSVGGGQATAQRASDDEETSAAESTGGSAPAGGVEQGPSASPNPMLAALWNEAVVQPMGDAVNSLGQETPDLNAAMAAVTRAQDGAKAAYRSLSGDDPQRVQYLTVLAKVDIVMEILAERTSSPQRMTDDQIASFLNDAYILSQSLGRG
jgi:hypothetical protein